MHDHPLSRLLMKAKLLRRSSSSSVPQAVNVKAGTRADPRSNSNSHSSCGLPPQSHLFAPDEADIKTRDYSIVSSLPVDHLSPSPEEIPGPATASSADQGQSYFDQVDAGSAPPEEKDKQVHRPDNHPSSFPSSPTTGTSKRGQRNQEPHFQSGSDNRGPRVPSDQQRPGFSPPQTPLTTELHTLPSPSITPSTPASEQFDSASTTTAPQSASSKLRERPGSAVVDSQLTPSLDTVAEYPPSESNYPSYFPPSNSKRPTLATRRQSLLPPSQQHLVSGLLDPGLLFQNGSPVTNRLAAVNPEMVVTRKLWVKRPGGSATLVPILEDALVDELRDQVIMKYANSLGKTFDSPDIIIRISPRTDNSRPSMQDRILSPEESLMAVVDTYYPGGQTIEEALVIEIPSRRTPKPSPRHPVYYHQHQPGDHGEYFPIMPANPTPPSHASNQPGNVNPHSTPSISILTTGMVPPLPSPGNRAARLNRRPPLTRHTTNSPTLLGQATASIDPAVTSNSQPPPPVPASIPTPPNPPPESPQTKTHTPPVAAATASPRSRPPLKQKKGSNSQSLSAVFGGLIDGTVPPINVLIVEDNIINQKLLEAFMKRLKVRWKCAANGEEAVKKWRQGGFHLVLMDIQLPVMNGLDATKEIRRLERLNGIGVFPKTASGRSSAASASAASPPERPGGPDNSLNEEDTLNDLSLFKSPVIIVALTASSLQSDRHEALAAGCNDFLTKPVGFPWLEQKVTEWGCMQALIDFEGWRKWRGFANDPQPSPSPTTDGHASPMQIGANGVPRKSLPGSPIAPAARSPAPLYTDTNPIGDKSESRPSNFPDEPDIVSGELPEDGSGSDVPASPLTSAVAGDHPGEIPIPDME